MCITVTDIFLFKAISWTSSLIHWFERDYYKYLNEDRLTLISPNKNKNLGWDLFLLFYHERYVFCLKLLWKILSQKIVMVTQFLNMWGYPKCNYYFLMLNFQTRTAKKNTLIKWRHVPKVQIQVFWQYSQKQWKLINLSTPSLEGNVFALNTSNV